MRWVGGDLIPVVAEVLGRRVVASAAVGGGDTSHAFHVRLEGAPAVFVKSGTNPPPGLFAAEAAGLRWLRETNTVRVPAVVAVRDDPELLHRFLVLEWIEPGPPGADHDEDLGRALAGLHRFPCARFGFESDGFIGPLPQDNTPCPTWPELYATRRLLPLARQAVDTGRLSPATGARIDDLCARLEDRCGPPEPPSRLHGDLWAGNALTDARGRPVLVDPSAYGGHREVDLAMMRLFGGFTERTFAAYAESFPLAAGHQDRVPLYQLYPLLVHVLLFGGSYASSVTAALDRLG